MSMFVENALLDAGSPCGHIPLDSSDSVEVKSKSYVTHTCSIMILEYVYVNNVSLYLIPYAPINIF